MRPTLKKFKISEIFSSIQGESTYAGERCAFVRLIGCNLRCSYCDTKYAYEGGSELSLDEIVNKVIAFDVPLVEITGGEPLLHEGVTELAQAFLDSGLEVLIETNGSQDISILPKQVVKVIDVKTPTSGEVDSFLYSILDSIDTKDQLKFVIGSREDYLWAKAFLEGNTPLCKVIFSPSWGVLEPKDMVEWIVEDKLNVRVGIQLHKVIWDADTQGV